MRNSIKGRIYKTQQNSRCRLYGDRDETIKRIIYECSQLAQKEDNTRHNWVGKVIYWIQCKKFKFDHTNKWYVHNPESVLENEMHKLLWDFDIQMNHRISSRRPDLVIINKKQRTYRIADFVVPADLRVKLKGSEKKAKYLDLAWELNNQCNMKLTTIPIVICGFGTVTKDWYKNWRIWK